MNPPDDLRCPAPEAFRGPVTHVLREAFLPAMLLVALAPHALPAQSGAPGGEWPYYGGDVGHTRYAPLERIDAENAGALEVAWRWSARNFGPRPEGAYRVTPLMVDGVVYATAGFRRVAVAIDAATGETLWMHRMDEGERGRRAPRLNSGRGVAYWPGGEGEPPRIFYITPGYHMWALDAATGRPVASFGEDGVVDLMTGLRPPEGVDPVGSIGSSSPPLVVGDALVVGSALHVGFRPPSPSNVPGDVRAFDARTGERLWSFRVVPRNGEPGADTWKSDSNAYTGNAGVWTPFSADPDLGLVYLPTEAPTHDFYGGHRPGDNLYSSSLVALDARTGERVWHRQLVHHDIWDFDTPAPPVLVDVEVDGRRVRAVAQVTKQSWAYVFDRRTGEPLWPLEERPVPGSNVPGEEPSPTQPVPAKPPPFSRQGVSEDDLMDFTPELRRKAREAVADLRLGPIFTPVELSDSENGYRGTLMVPGTTGGANWEGAAVDPATGVLYVGSQMNPSTIGLVSGGEASEARFIVGRAGQPRVQGLPVLKPPYGQISAIDLNRGEIAWQVPNADTPVEIADHPALTGVDPGRTGRPARVGLLVTGTFFFAGEGPGGKPLLRAHDKSTGEIVAEVELPAPQTGVPMTYLHEDEQYVVVAVAAPDRPAELVALKLP